MSISCRFSLTQFQKAINGFIDSQRRDKARHVSPSRIVAPKIFRFRMSRVKGGGDFS